MKRLLSWCLALCLLIAMVPVQGTMAAETEKTVTFRLVGATLADEEIDMSGADVTVDNYGSRYVTWVPTMELGWNKLTTVRTLVKAAAEQYGLTVTGIDGDYVSAITAPEAQGGYRLAEKQNGPYSGWMYTINGSHPGVSYSTKYLKAGDQVIFHYVNDYRYEVPDWSGGSLGTAEDWNAWLDAPEGETEDEEDNLQQAKDQAIRYLNKTVDASEYRQAEQLSILLLLQEGTASIEAAQTEQEVMETLLDFQGKLRRLKTAAEYEAEEESVDWKKIYEQTGTYLMDTVTEPEVGSTYGEWAVLGAARSDLAFSRWLDEYYETVEAYVKDNIDKEGRLPLPGETKTQSTENSRLILALTAVGADATAVGGHNLLTALEHVAFVENSGTNGPVFALLAADSGAYELKSREALLQSVLDAQLRDGGWAVSGTSSEVDMTAMAVQALAPYCSGNAQVETAVEKALDYLKQQQSEDGGFRESGTANAESTAQVIIALTALGEDPAEFVSEEENSVLDALCKFHVEGSGFRHCFETGADGVNQMATEQAYLALTAYDRLLKGKTALYDMSDVERKVFADRENTAEEFETAVSEVVVRTANRATLQKLEQLNALYEELQDTQKDEAAEAYETLLQAWQLFDALLEQAKEEAEEEWREAFREYDEEDYTTKQWNELERAYEDGLDEIQKADCTNEVETALSEAMSAMEEAAGSQGDIQVSFRLIGDSQHDNGVTDHDTYVTWISTTKYDMEQGDTVYDLFMEAISDYGLSQKGAESGYVRSIKAPKALGGFWLGEFDNGPDSGWMYTVDGDHPGVGLKDYELSDGDRVIWHYVDDHILEEKNGSGKYHYRWLEAEDIDPDEYAQEQDETEKETESSVTDFADVKPGDWFYEDVSFAVEEGLFEGTSNTAFSPNSAMTRAMLVTVLYRLDGEQKASVALTFADIKGGQYYTEAVRWAVEQGIVNGYDGSRFGPNDRVTREQLAAILYRYAQYRKLDTSASESLMDYADFSEISVYALKALKWAKAENLIGGRSADTLAPGGNATRAEVAAILHRFVEQVAGGTK